MITQSIRGRLTILVGASLATLLLFGALAYRTIAVVRIHGPLYERVVQAKDLGADVLPPPLYAVEAYLVVHQLVIETSDSGRRALVARGIVLRREFEERRAFWDGALADGELKRTLLTEAYRPAEEFFEARDGQFVPAVLGGDRRKADEVMQRVLVPKYAEHRAAIDRVVALSGQAVTDQEALAATEIFRSLAILAALAAGLAISAVGLGWTTTRAILRPIGSLTDVIDRMKHGDLTVRGGLTSHDEVAQMGRALDGALDQLEASFQAISQNAQTLASASEELASVSAQMGSNAEETSAQSGVVAAAAEQVSKNVQTVATGTEEMS
ncbi:MAG: methyl-accepting chemotaxis protein, partial [Gemmatimonadota bacterium]|nr:methyl-accepting chemotaxis protein [Gemmatimonadota bacterium]